MAADVIQIEDGYIRKSDLADRRMSKHSVEEGPDARQIDKYDWLFSSIVHDLRNPLTAISAGTQMLMNCKLAPAEVKRLAANMDRAAGRMRELITDIACTLRGHKSVPDICNIRQVIAAAWESAVPATENHSIEISLEVPGEIDAPFVHSRLERVFFNILTNSLEAMPDGGRIRVGAVIAGNCALIDVEDSGPGVPSSIRGRLFEPFITAGKRNGLGLGLALSRQVVQDQGGDLWYEPAAGARFVVCLRLAETSSAGV